MIAWVGWLVEFNVGLEKRIGLLPTVWNSSRRMIRGHAITILILYGGDGFGIPRGIIWMETWRTLYPRWILHAPGAISVHDSVLPGQPRTRAVQFGSESSSDLATTDPNLNLKVNMIKNWSSGDGLSHVSFFSPFCLKTSSNFHFNTFT